MGWDTYIGFFKQNIPVKDIISHGPTKGIIFHIDLALDINS